MIRPVGICIASLYCCFSTIFAVAQTTATEIVLATDINYPPFSSLSTQKSSLLTGQFIDLIQKIDSNLTDFNIRLVPLKWKNALADTQDGKVHGIVGVAALPQKRPYLIAFSDVIYTENVVVACHKNTIDNELASWPEDFVGQRVVNIAGYDSWLDYEVRSRQNTKYVSFFEAPSMAIAVKMLNLGNAACVLSEHQFLTTQTEVNIEELSVTTVKQNPLYVAFSQAGKNALGANVTERFITEFNQQFSRYKSLKKSY